MVVVRFYNVTDPYNIEDTPDPENHTPIPTIAMQSSEDIQRGSYFHIPYDQAPGLEALSTAATGNFQYNREHLVSASGQANSSPLPTNNINFLLNPTRSEGSVSAYILVHYK